VFTDSLCFMFLPIPSIILGNFNLIFIFSLQISVNNNYGFNWEFLGDRNHPMHWKKLIVHHQYFGCFSIIGKAAPKNSGYLFSLANQTKISVHTVSRWANLIYFIKLSHDVILAGMESICEVLNKLNITPDLNDSI